MATIHHRVGIQASVSKIHNIISTPEGLSTWWTQDVRGSGLAGEVLEFWFNESAVKFRVDLVSPIKIQWTCLECAPEWVGTQVVFSLDETENQCMVNFQHVGWADATPFFAHCNTKWAVFLLSLKDAIEKGQGRPFPQDVPIDHS